MDSHHPPFSLEIFCDNSQLVDCSGFYYDFKNAEYSCINQYLNELPWDDLLGSISNVDDMVDTLYHHLNISLQNFVAKRKKTQTSYPHWFNKRTIWLINQKRILHKHFKTTRTEEDYKAFSDMRLACKLAIRSNYADYIAKIEHSIKGNSNTFWNFISDRKSSSSLPEAFLVGGNKRVAGGLDISNAFAAYFSSSYKSPSIESSSLVTTENVNLSSISVTVSEVERALIKLKKQGAGPDGFPALYYKSASSSLSKPLQMIFQVSLSTGQFPTCWKMAFVVPVFKNGNKSNVSNYRPISLLSIPAKVFECIVSERLFSAFKNIICDGQHGFFKGRSTLTNLLIYTDYILKSFETGNEVHSIYFDFSKAFDTVNHKLLLHKLGIYGIHGPMHRWFETYLELRYQQVKINGFMSERFHVKSGVPQGSNIGPLLFIIFINDIGSKLGCNHLLYADDLKLFQRIVCSDDCRKLQIDIENIFIWCLENDMSLNTKKTFAMKFSRKREPVHTDYLLFDQVLNNVTLCKDLGIFFDPKLSFAQHIDYLVSKCLRTIGCIKRYTVDFKNINSVTILYNSFVRSSLEYCCVLWSPFYSTHSDKLDAVQGKFLRYVRYKLSKNGVVLHNLGDILKYLGVLPLHIRRSYHQLCFVFRLVNDFISVPYLLEQLKFYVPSYATRCTDMFCLGYHRSSYAQYGPLNNVMRTCNLYASELSFFSISVSRFKSIALMILSSRVDV